MDLLSVGLYGYQRFENDLGDMDVTGSPVAIVGPNEAGKTSFLEALERLNDGDFKPKNKTRGYTGETLVRARYALSPEDRAAIRHVGGIGSPVLFTYSRRHADSTSSHYALKPSIERDLTLRNKASQAATKVLKSKWLESREPTADPGDGEEKLAAPDEVLEGLINILDLNDQSLNESHLDGIAEAVTYLRDLEDASAAAKKLAEQLEKLRDLEATPHPRQAAAEILIRRMPRFLMFDPDWRQLESEFRFAEDEGPSAPMAALFDLIGFSLDELSAAISANDQTTVAELLIVANDAFVRLFKDRWSQANLHVYIRVNENVVHVYVKTANGRLIPIADRSAGLRQFIALLAFVESHREEGERVILLVHEAETHLHYNAQADLVNIFTRQTFVDKIIYTTHSAGCLPLDLGTGVRVIEPVGPEGIPREEWERSKINNAFWTGGPGFSPLLMAMGASSFVFAALRKAVVGEGVTEVILLPTILREATGKPLDFQVAPGVSSVHPDAVRELDETAARLAYIVDGDRGGMDHRQKLIDNGVEEERIVILGAAEELAIEDVVGAGIYLEAVNRVLGFYEKPLCPTDRIGHVGRKAAVKAWCAANGVEKPGEREVAQQILEVAAGRRREGEPVQVLDEARRALVLEAHSKLKALLG